MYFYILLKRGKVNLTDVYNASVNYDNPNTHKNNLHMVLYKMDWLTLRLVTQHLARRLCIYTINCALSNKPSFGIGVYFFYIWSNFLNLRHLVWDCVWLYELSPYSIRFSVHPALCESACKFQPIWPLNLWP
jgi:hypothetical protein